MHDPAESHRRQTLIEKTTAIVFIALLLLACLKVAQPFVPAIVGGTVLCVSLWPFYLHLTGWLGGRRRLAAILLTVFTATVFVVPVGVGAGKLFEGVPALETMVGDLSWLKPGEPPAWVGKLPLVGGKLAEAWHQGLKNVKPDPEKIRFWVVQAVQWILAQGADFAVAMAQIILATVIAGLFYVCGEDAAAMLRKLAGRIGGEHSALVIDVAGRTIRGVSLGVIGTALLQALLSGFGFALAGVPMYSLLAVVCFVTALLQIGTGVVWIPVALWLGHHDEKGWAVFTVVFGIFINTIDNFIKPYFMSKGSDLPLILIYTGVIGGLLAWGFMGMFVGATLLAVAYTLFREWLEREPA
jgi:predicted PurR-regulated permease PerM